MCISHSPDRSADEFLLPQLSPALSSSPYYDIAKKYFGGRGGGILTVRAGSREKAFRLINSLEYALIATNIGDVKTLVIHPASTIYTHSTEEQKINAGVYDDTIRISVGIEDTVTVNDEFLENTQFEETVLSEGDNIEFLYFMGGGQ